MTTNLNDEGERERDKFATRRTSSKSFIKTKITNNEYRLRKQCIVYSVQCRFCSFVSHTRNPQSGSENDLSLMKRFLMHILYYVPCNYDKLWSSQMAQTKQREDNNTRILVGWIDGDKCTNGIYYHFECRPWMKNWLNYGHSFIGWKVKIVSSAEKIGFFRCWNHFKKKHKLFSIHFQTDPYIS